MRTLVLPILAAVACLTAAISCKREERSFTVPPAAAQESVNVPYMNVLRPGPTANQMPSTLPVDVLSLLNESFAQQFANNAQAVSDGQRLYEQFNCVGCHAHGGGGMAPPLIDQKWFYGSDPKNVYLTILQGRPNGMPSFRGRIPDYEIWELVSYVRSLSGQASSNASPGREDHLSAQPPPNSITPETPVESPQPTTGPAVRTLGP